MTVFELGKRPLHIPTVAQEVFDVTGAGDTVIATATLALLAGATIGEAARIANAAAGIVVGKIGTATVTPQELKTALAGG
jgi:D-beta-D-heptose 7-phosphate kinase/D-beta-D-heptose 1-phosphate adenosyltransferase